MPRQDHVEKSGPLAGHIRRGRVYLSTLAATDKLTVGDWVRDDLPDLLWPVLVFAEVGTHAGGRRFIEWQKRVQHEFAGSMERQFLADCLDGRLTSLDRLIRSSPTASNKVRTHALDSGLLSPSVRHALSSYPDRPAEWLADMDVHAPDQGDIDLLARAVLEVIKDEHREAVTKCLYIWSAVQAGTFSTDAATIETLKDYPGNVSKRTHADTVVRASWGSLKGLRLATDENYYDDAILWAKVFWGMNSMTTRCLRKREVVEDVTQEQETGESEVREREEVGDARLDGHSEGRHDLQQMAMDLLASYIEALETSSARLYDPEPQEVNAGLVSRAGREVIAILGAPELWCSEHAAHVGRLLIETRIYLEWMAKQDASVYARYKEYGSGKAKLYARIFGESATTWLQPGQQVTDAIKELERLSHNNEVIDHRIVDTRSTAMEGKSVRALAEEVGLSDLYRTGYQLQSGVVHSEWWSIEMHSMERCLNVLHRGHLIPSMSLPVGRDEQLAHSWVNALYALMRISLSILGTEAAAVTSAFEWLDTNADEDTEPATPS